MWAGSGGRREKGDVERDIWRKRREREREWEHIDATRVGNPVPVEVPVAARPVSAVARQYHLGKVVPRGICWFASHLPRIGANARISAIRPNT
jgi:hypothetical protein